MNEDINKNDYTYWKNYREELTELLKEPVIKLEKNEKNIYDMSKKIGVKATARYYNVYPSTVRYYIKKYEEKNL